MPPSLDVPEFVREAVANERDAEAAAQDLTRAFGGARPSTAGSRRLLEAVTELPLRYAPFFDRLSELWDLPEPDVRAVLEQSKDPKVWQRPLLPGIALLPVVGGPRTQGANARLARFSPGFVFPRHRHPGPERVLVLEGSYTDSAGRVVRPGELQEMDPGSEHSLHVATDGPCIAALVEHGPEFTGFLLGALQRLIGR